MIRTAVLLLGLLALTACGVRPPPPGDPRDVAALAAEIRGLSPNIDPAEAARAAQVAYRASFDLSRAYGITDPPLVHNAKVNAGTRPRGLCYHWAEDLQALLDAEGFATLQTARAIANSDRRFFIEHSTTVITPKGAPMQAGIVVDPWRDGGRLFWSKVPDDPRYVWVPRKQVLKETGRIRYVQRTAGSLVPLPIE
ncbi:putative lipoprotein [Sulfitobacter noctilucae]|uniref:hypothetical protein n=1 Tax=Sulfitobacter noctilucae TaxID=1342302 RepID=UPI000469F622|nr:hypothetical protein [Sulfitobacter noctilucae]KIN61247.1 putative lipoprotein [Sulfitobacter noctilucae]